MKTVKLNNTSLELSNICLGGGSFGSKLSKEEVFELLDAYTVAGGNFVDTANFYCKWIPGLNNCSEEIIGEWLKTRDAYNKVVVATKGAHYYIDNPKKSRVNKRDVKKDLEESLKTLGLEQINLYWLHRDDEAKPVEEIIEIMEGFVKEGKIRYYGASNYKLERMRTAAAYAAQNGYQGFSAVSNQWSLAAVNPGKATNPDPTLVSMTEEYLRWHIETKMPAIPFSASAFGFFEKLHRLRPRVKDGVLLTPYDELSLAEDMKRAYINEHNLRIYEKLLEVKNEYPYSLYTLSIAYLLNQPFNVIPICSVRNTAQLDEFIQASEIILLGRNGRRLKMLHR